ncbi:cysteine peptidase family C39 domain-containing protein [Mucilaginibacter sp. OK283]|jgi:ABC-type bacteriocin/lantibiotic exporter with double-glycine peptidase domain|uniref:cysteine peptidase family C39 domain-containing protein n=1 Tax=Mucilaginibacter sp. OK283 TaxID=1881049 RepID=UPI0008C555AC|nr:cysteine peptidase family C39 domain-containing protein [Mucilaginibacter sp. OK283]SEO79687.1 Peptidase C39 family protein [Mucilaginibacter sp. OK283]
MKFNHFYIKNTFVKQEGQNDCGIACLESILYYAGLDASGIYRLKNLRLCATGVSLLSLKHLAIEFGLQAKCVELEVTYLRALTVPCILYVINGENAGHFIVFYGARKKGSGYEYLVGDPADDLKFITETHLSEIWKSNAALYLEGLKPAKHIKRVLKSVALLDNAISVPLLMSVPLLGIIISFIGIGTSLFLQKCFESGKTNSPKMEMMASLAMFLIISIFRTVLGFLRQRLLTCFLTDFSRYFMFRKLNRLLNHGYVYNIDNAFNQVVKLQSAINALLSVVLTDGVLLMIIIGMLFYYFPLVALINLLYLVIVVLLSSLMLPKISLAIQDNEKCFHNAVKKIKTEMDDISTENVAELKPDLIIKHQNYYLSYEQSSVSNANSINRMNLIIQGTGNLLVILVLGVSIHNFLTTYKEGMLFLAVSILSVYNTMIVPRVIQAYQACYDGVSSLQIR